MVTATVKVGNFPHGVAVTPDGTKVYVTNAGDSTVSVIDTTTNTVTTTMHIGKRPVGVAVTPK
jgi:YVTN family beta-propeller protein